MTGCSARHQRPLRASAPTPEPRVVRFVADQPLESLHISVVTLAEIRFGIEVLGGMYDNCEY